MRAGHSFERQQRRRYRRALVFVIVLAYMAVLALAAVRCTSAPAEPCEMQTRWLARFEHYETVCWVVYEGPEGTAINCVTWPDDGAIPEWLGDFAVMQERGVLREIEVCRDTPIGGER